MDSLVKRFTLGSKVIDADDGLVAIEGDTVVSKDFRIDLKDLLRRIGMKGRLGGAATKHLKVSLEDEFRKFIRKVSLQLFRLPLVAVDTTVDAGLLNRIAVVWRSH